MASEPLNWVACQYACKAELAARKQLTSRAINISAEGPFHLQVAIFHTPFNNTTLHSRSDRNGTHYARRPRRASHVAKRNKNRSVPPRRQPQRSARSPPAARIGRSGRLLGRDWSGAGAEARESGAPPTPTREGKGGAGSPSERRDSRSRIGIILDVRRHILRAASASQRLN